MGGEGEVGYGGFGGWVERGWGEVYSIDGPCPKIPLKSEINDATIYFVADLGDIYTE